MESEKVVNLNESFSNIKSKNVKLEFKYSL